MGFNRIEPARAGAETTMERALPSWFEEFIEDHFKEEIATARAEGKAQGVREGLAAAILATATARRIALPDDFGEGLADRSEESLRAILRGLNKVGDFQRDRRDA